MYLQLFCGCRIKDMYCHVSQRSGQKAPLVADDVFEIIMKVFSSNFNFIIYVNYYVKNILISRVISYWILEYIAVCFACYAVK